MNIYICSNTIFSKMKDLKKYQFLACIFIGFLFFPTLNAQTTKNEFWKKSVLEADSD